MEENCAGSTTSSITRLTGCIEYTLGFWVQTGRALDLEVIFSFTLTRQTNSLSDPREQVQPGQLLGELGAVEQLHQRDAGAVSADRSAAVQAGPLRTAGPAASARAESSTELPGPALGRKCSSASCTGQQAWGRYLIKVTYTLNKLCYMFELEFVCDEISNKHTDMYQQT